MTQAQTPVVKDEDLLPEERQWIFGSDGDKETADRKLFQLIDFMKIATAGFVLLAGMYSGQVFEPSSNNQTEVPVQTK